MGSGQMVQQGLFGVETADGDRDAWATPSDLFKALAAEFDFGGDLAAEAWSAKCERYLTRENNALIWNWSMWLVAQWGFLNPPFSEIAIWIEKVRREAEQGARIIVVLPAHRCEQPWFHQHVIGYAREVRMIRRRVDYTPPPGIKQSSPKFPSMVLVYDGPGTGETLLRGM